MQSKKLFFKDYLPTELLTEEINFTIKIKPCDKHIQLILLVDSLYVYVLTSHNLLIIPKNTVLVRVILL